MEKEEIRRVYHNLINQHGVDLLKNQAYPIMQELIGKSKIKRSLGDKAQFMLNVGMENIPTTSLLIAIECVMEVMEVGEEKERIQKSYEYWRENEEDILNDNRVTEKARKS